MSTRRTFARPARLAAIAPYLWMVLFFLLPFGFVVKISLSQTALAQPPYLPVLDLAAGWPGLRDFAAGLSFDSYRVLGSDWLYLMSYLRSLAFATLSTLILLLTARRFFEASRNQNPQPAHSAVARPGTFAREPSQRRPGRVSRNPFHIPWAGWKEILWGAYVRLGEDRLLATAAGVLLASYLLHNLIRINSDSPALAAIVFALILGVLNAFLRPVLLLLTLPLNLLTLGLFTLVVNAIVFWLATVVQGGDVQVADFGAALLGSVIVSAVSFVASRVLT